MQIVLYVKDLVKLQVCNTFILFPITHNNYREVQTQNKVKYSCLQIYGGPRSLSHDFKIWPVIFKGSGPSEPILFTCEKKLTLIKIFILQQTYELHKTESTCRLSIQKNQS